MELKHRKVRWCPIVILSSNQILFISIQLFIFKIKQ